MPERESTGCWLAISDDGLTAELVDKRRRCRWRLEPASRWVSLAGAGEQARRVGLPPGRVAPAGDAALVAEHPLAAVGVGAGATLRVIWRLERDHVAVVQAVTGQGVAAASWPGRFVPVEGDLELVVPSYQGVLVRRSGGTWRFRCERGGHRNASLGVAALLGERAGLALVPEHFAGWSIDCGETDEGLWLAFEDTPCPVAGWGERVMRLYPVGNSVTDVARCYRAFAQQQGRFTSWGEKIDARPSVANVFGSLMAFTGYVADPELDYVANVRALKARGFDSIMLFPLRFLHYSQSFTMAGGLGPVCIDDARIAELEAMGGVHPGPWGWVFEGIDDGSERMSRIYRRDAQGELMPVWSMDGQQWNMVCPAYQAEHMRARLASDMAWTRWIHFDVNATFPARPCWGAAHLGHEGEPMSRARDIELTRQLLSGATVGDRVISSEGFNDAYTSSYDIGTTKMMPLEGPRPAAMPVPLTMLVYHDCCIHDWWELHNYNENPGWPVGERTTGGGTFGRAGSGEPRLKAALDALYGQPPSVFPFGKQYAWRDLKTRETYAFQIRQEDAAVQAALAAALPVTRLHRRVGKQAMTDFAFVSDDRLVQQTTFADGTRVLANLGAADAEVAGVGPVKARRWRVMDAG